MNKEQLLALAELERRRRENEGESKRIYYQTHPLDYFQERLGIAPETINWELLPDYAGHKWDGTPNPFMRILDSLIHNKWVGVESATGTGKTFNSALIALWFLECFNDSLVVTTAPKEAQLSLHIWKEIGKLYGRFNKGELTSLKLRMNSGKDDWLAVGFVAGVGSAEESSTKAQGFHATHMLFILEETPGINPAVITAFQNTCTSNHNLILALGNPDHQLDELHKFCMQDNVEHIRISAYDHPNVVLNNPLFIPGAASIEGINRMLSRYGKENPLFLSRAKGISPAQSIDSLINIKWVRDAEQIPEGYTPIGQKALGVDVANSEAGDKACIAQGIGNCLTMIKDFQCPDATQLGKRDVMALIRSENIPADRVGVDGVGVGAATVNGLKELNIKVVDLQGGSAPVVDTSRAEQFNNLRSQMYWQMREDLREGKVFFAIRDEELIAELTTPKWEIKSGKIAIESKEEIKKRLGRSPNKADAVVYWNWVRQNIAKNIVTITKRLF